MIRRSCETSAELREALHAKVEADFKEVSVDPSRTPSFTGPSDAPEKVGLQKVGEIPRFFSAILSRLFQSMPSQASRWGRGLTLSYLRFREPPSPSRPSRAASKLPAAGGGGALVGGLSAGFEGLLGSVFSGGGRASCGDGLESVSVSRQGFSQPREKELGQLRWQRQRGLQSASNALVAWLVLQTTRQISTSALDTRLCGQPARCSTGGERTQPCGHAALLSQGFRRSCIYRPPQLPRARRAFGSGTASPCRRSLVFSSGFAAAAASSFLIFRKRPGGAQTATRPSVEHVTL